MSNFIIAEGKTTNEAIENGLKELKVSKDRVEIKVLENENKKSFFDILAPKTVKVELKEREARKPEEFEIETTAAELKQAEEDLKKFLEEFTSKLPEGTTFDIEEKDKIIIINIEGDKIGNIIGYRGEALYALENILKAIANKKSENRVIVRLDIESYKEKRIKALEDFANKKAKVVEKTGKTNRSVLRKFR